MRVLSFRDIPRGIPYEEALVFQKKYRERRQKEDINDLLILLEHDPAVFTVGRRDQKKNILTPPSVPVVPIDRGGEITYHGPGQLVGYLIADLSVTAYSLRIFIEKMERALRDFLYRKFSLVGERDPVHRGVWIGREKIAAIGIEIHRKVSMHGFALNIRNDLKIFEEVIPCGILGRGVTSVKKETGLSEFDFSDLKRELLKDFSSVFGYDEVRPYRPEGA